LIEIDLKDLEEFVDLVADVPDVAAREVIFSDREHVGIGATRRLARGFCGSQTDVAATGPKLSDSRMILMKPPAILFSIFGRLRTAPEPSLASAAAIMLMENLSRCSER
jgi:hypothetical protein